MTLEAEVSTPIYQCVWKDANELQGGTRFFAVDDTAALAIATKLADLSGCQLMEFAKVLWIAGVSTHEPLEASNIQDKTWMHFTAPPVDGREKPLKLSIPALDRSLLEDGGRKTDTDLLEGVGKLTTRAGGVAEKFVKGINVYGLRKRDKVK